MVAFELSVRAWRFSVSAFKHNAAFCKKFMRQKEKVHAKCSQRLTRACTHKCTHTHNPTGIQAAVKVFTDAPDPVGVFILQADTFIDKAVDGALIGALRVMGEQRQAELWGIHQALSASQIPSKHDKRRSGESCRSTALRVLLQLPLGTATGSSEHV